MRTIGVKLQSEQAEAFQVAAIRHGLTVSAAIAAILREATADFTDFSCLEGVEQPKRGRAAKVKAKEQLTACFANGETVEELFDRFERKRRAA